MWRSLLTLALTLLAAPQCAAMSRAERFQMRETVREMFHHAYDGYMQHAFPHDELKPLTQTWTDSLVELGNSVHVTRAGYKGVALTLIDSLDTLAVLGNASEFAWGVNWVAEHVSFDLDVDVHLFETNIRVLGGLLSAHLIASGQCRGAEHLAVDGYRDQLLTLALDLGTRLLGAFDGCSRLPRAFVNLRGRTAKHARMEQCTAGVGTLLLEMGVLSRLSGQPRFEQAALCALRLLWSKRSSLNLLGNTLDVSSGAWRNANAGIGAGIDSFYEYLLKGYLVFGRPELFAMWNASYAAVNKHLRRGAWYGEGNMHQGGKATVPHFESLQAFWPALQVLAGDVDDAAESFASFFELWRRYRVLPERVDLQRNVVHPHAAAYPLRPELAESCYALYRATNDPSYLQAGAAMVHSLNAVARTPAGFASIKTVLNMAQEDHMTSFFMAETLKYLYLLFDDDNFLNVHAASFVFTTEGHLVPLKSAFSSLLSDADALPPLASVEAMRTVELRELISAAGLSHTDCVEMSELRARARDAHDLLQQRSTQAQEAEEQARQRHEHKPDLLVCGAAPPAQGDPHSARVAAAAAGAEGAGVAPAAAPPAAPPAAVPAATAAATAAAVSAKDVTSTKGVVEAAGGKLRLRASARGIAVEVTGGGRALWAAARQERDPPPLGSPQARQERPHGETVVARIGSSAPAVAAGEQDATAAVEWAWKGHGSGGAALLGPTHRLTLAKKDGGIEQRGAWGGTWAAAEPTAEGAEGEAKNGGLQPPLRHALPLLVVSSCATAGVAAAVRRKPGAAVLLLDGPPTTRHDGRRRRKGEKPPPPRHACDLAKLAQAAAAAGASALVVRAGLSCDGTDAAASAAAAAAAADDDDDDASPGHEWAEGWPAPRGPPRLCREAAEVQVGAAVGAAAAAGKGQGQGGGVRALPALLMGAAAHQELADAVAAAGSDATLQLLVEPTSEVQALERLPPAWRGVSVDTAKSDVSGLPGSLRLTSPPSEQPRWRLELHAPGEGVLRADVREWSGGAWRSTKVVISRRQELERRGCHKEDGRKDHTCKTHADCGVSGERCTQRQCSAYGFCFSPTG